MTIVFFNKKSNKVFNPAAYLRWVRSGWRRSSECTAGRERAVNCRKDGHHMNNVLVKGLEKTKAADQYNQTA